MKLTIDVRRRRARLEPVDERGGGSTTTDSALARVPRTGEFLRVDDDDRLAKVMAVIWEPDGCITLELDERREGDVGAVDAGSDIAAWWFG